ncbi:MAG: threonine--tRNA ligase, partial [Cyanobacteria bacterium HKST-UBA01]|nr:threonine--tRNA ligase [Cyanobacteria bacterium HKST-UBA01]
EWQGPTIQVDLNLPRRFDVSYIGEDGEKHRAIMIHRAVLGSMERFVGGLIEHYAGAFPLWLAPTQVLVLPISDRHQEFASKVHQQLRDNDIRAHIDNRSETVNYRIREGQMQQIPYMVVIGDKEEAEGKVAIRHRRDGQAGILTVDELLAKLKSEIDSKEQ